MSTNNELNMPISFSISVSGLGENDTRNCSGLVVHYHESEAYTIWAIYSIVAPVLLLLGIIGNVAIFLVIGYVCPNTTTCSHLRSRAVFDTISTVFTVIPLFLQHSAGIQVLTFSRASCSILTYIRYTSSDISIWLVLVIAIDKFLAVWKPLKVRLLCQPTTAHRILLGLVGTSLLKDLHVLLARGLRLEKPSRCSAEEDYELECTTLSDNPFLYAYAKQVTPVVSLIFVSILPVFGITICNALITIILCRHRREWTAAITSESKGLDDGHTGLAAEDTTASAGNTNVSAVKNLASKVEKNLEKSERNSIMLTLINSTSFFIFVIPSFILCLLRHEFPLPFVVSDSYRENMLLAFTDMLIICHFTLNFYICCATSRSFRHKVRHYVLHRYHNHNGRRSTF